MRWRLDWRHQARERYLSIPPGKTDWLIGDKPGSTAAYIQSAAAAKCPASYRNRQSEWLNMKSWQYSDKGWRDDPGITVTCSNHSPLYYWLEFTLLSYHLSNKSYLLYDILFILSSSVTLAKEEYAFSFLSLSADVGGVLGIFIGFNFLSNDK